MPYADVEAAEELIAYSVELTFSIDKRWAKVGEIVKFSGRLTRDGEGWGGQSIVIQMYEIVDETGVWYDVLDTVTDADGYYDTEMVVPFELPIGIRLPCEDRWWRTLHPDTDTGSNYAPLAIAYPTFIEAFTVPAEVVTGKPFTVEGQLLYEYDTGDYRALPDRVVNIYVNGSLVASPITDADGWFSADITIDAPGSYTIRAYFPGEGLPGGSYAHVMVERGVRVSGAPPTAKVVGIVTGAMFVGITLLLAGIST